MDRTEFFTRLPRAVDGQRAAMRAETHLEHSVAAALQAIAAACAEREAPPIKAARRHLAEVYGATRLSRHRERRPASA